MSNPVGRPLKYSDPAELQRKIDEYFEACDNHISKGMDKLGNIVEFIDPQPYTVTGLANALDIDRLTLLEYENQMQPSLHKLGDAAREEIVNSIKKAKAKCEEYAERKLYQLRNPAGAIFNLLNNYKGWSNKQELEVSRAPEKLDAAEVNKLLEE
jgi:hypothetical protein